MTMPKKPKYLFGILDLEKFRYLKYEEKLKVVRALHKAWLEEQEKEG